MRYDRSSLQKFGSPSLAVTTASGYSIAQRMSALEHIEHLNDRMRELEEKLEDTQPDSLIPATPPYPKPVENCCACICAWKVIIVFHSCDGVVELFC